MMEQTAVINLESSFNSMIVVNCLFKLSHFRKKNTKPIIVMPPRKQRRSTESEVTQTTVKKEEKETTPIITTRVLSRKEYYLVTTLLYMPKTLMTVRDKSVLIEAECKPQLFTNERKAKDYLKEKAEKLKSMLIEEGSYMAIETEGEGSPKVVKKNFITEDFTTQEYNEELIILGFDEKMPFKPGEYWAFIKWYAVILNDTLPPNVQGTGRRSKQRIAKAAASSSASVQEKEKE